ncbi:NAD(P)/FAD-dependent oxidoreductase [Lentzea sp. NPDC058436]|uniref:NAD(P)/FAD-dependent oxidoreductase n=1 Tax=Lentzea sp. NPDC058436 TaxID=3346499 RepID=UPI00364B27A0
MKDVEVHPSIADAECRPFWLDGVDRHRHAGEQLTGHRTCDLVVIGGGYTGLWTSLLAKERDPDLDVVLLEAEQVGWAASGRNGGFVSPCLTHTTSNGVRRFAGEMPRLEALGRQNLNEIGEAVRRYGIDCDWQRPGELLVATQPWQLDDLRQTARFVEQFGGAPALLDAAEVRKEIDSPTYVGALADPEGSALVDPVRLVDGLHGACVAANVRVHEHTRATSIDVDGAGVTVTTLTGTVRARKVALATSVFAPLLRRLRWYLIPVYDYVLVTEPLSQAQLADVGWQRRQGVFDAAHQFHYYRLTADNRILWGGYDAIYHYGNRIDESLERRKATANTLATHFFETFPQLEGIRFTHSWGGVIDACTRFSPFFGTSHRGRVAYAAGYTGLGVGASRFGARVMLELLHGDEPELRDLTMVRERPRPFPPEPFRYAGVQLTRWSHARADAADGEENLWLRAMNRLGYGFGS